MPKSLAPTQHPQKDAGEPNTGEAAAALKNRTIKARLQIIEALQRLGIPHAKWPDFVRAFHTNPQEREGYTASVFPPSFQPPVFERLNESPEQWAKAADAAWQQHRNAFLEKCRAWVREGVDEEIPPAKMTRGPGRRGRNAPPDLRAEWAACRLSGKAWKEIADEPFREDQVKKAASELLKLAGWPTKLKPPKTRKPDQSL
ncbi:MAG: hypothetical protein ACLQOO_00340 [Terriglobia bacterium]